LSQVRERQTWKDLNPDGTPISMAEFPLALALQGQSTQDKEYRILRKDGTEIWGLISGTPIYDRSGELIAGLIVFPDITERKQTEQALARERDLLHALMDNIPDIIYFKDRKSRFTRINRAHAQFLGIDDPRQAIGQMDFDFFTPEHAQDAFEDEQKIVRTGRSLVNKIERIRRADGRFLWVSATKVPIMDQEHRVIGIVGISRDIDKRVRTERALRQSETLLQSLLESLPQNVYSKDLEGRFTFANQRFCETEGKSRQDILGKTDYDLHPPELAQKYRADDRRVIETGQVWETVEKHEPLDGESTYVQVIKTPLYDLEGRAAGTLGLFWDITERKQAEEKILRLQHLLQNITNSMPSALVALDPDGKVLLWNPTAETLTQRSANQVQGQSLWQTCPELTRYRDLFEQVLREGQVAHRHKEQLAGETRTTYRDVDIFPLTTNDIEGAVLRIDDVTRRVQLEEIMLQSAKMASIGGLAAGVAHEINNPLSAIMQSAQMLQLALDTQHPPARQRLQDCGVDPEGLARYLQGRGLVEYLAGIRTTGARAAKIVSDLLNFSRKTASDVAPHDLNRLVEQTLVLAATDYDLKRKYDFRNIEIVRELAPDLPQIMCNGQQIQQVVLNLVRNAAQAMAQKIEDRGGEGEYRPRLTLRTSLCKESATRQLPIQDREWMCLEIEDNGLGIPEETQERLFEPFFTTKDEGEGTGLGLWLCWSIVVERHGGHIWVEPAKDGGSRFVVELPTIV
jgi:PAS domain S-box-containing protein